MECGEADKKEFIQLNRGYVNDLEVLWYSVKYLDAVLAAMAALGRI